MKIDHVHASGAGCHARAARWLRAARHGVRLVRPRWKCRTLILIVSTFAVICGWVGTGLREAERQELAIKRLEGFVWYDGNPRLSDWLDSRRWLFLLTGNRRFDTVRSFVVSPKVWLTRKIGDADVELYCKAFRRAEHVGLGHGSIRDYHLRHLRIFSRLRSLEIAHNAPFGDGLRHLQRMPALRRLVLTCPLTEVGKRHLGEITSLEDVNMVADDSCLAHLSRLPKLRSLAVARFITDDGLRHLTRIPTLVRLSLSSDRITDEGVKQLAACPNLKELSLQGSGVCDSMVARLSSLRRLEVLDLQETAVTDAAIGDLGKMQNLTDLNITGTRITKAGRDSLRRMLPSTCWLYWSSLPPPGSDAGTEDNSPPQANGS